MGLERKVGVRVLRVSLRDFTFILWVWRTLGYCEYRLQVQGSLKLKMGAWRPERSWNESLSQ